MKKIFTMFLSFLKIGAFTFGGGYAMIPLIEAEVVHKQNWINKDDFTDIVVISQSFPGALAVNTSVFIGYKVGGVIGAIMALLGTVLPSFFIIIFIAAFFMQFRSLKTVDMIFKGIGAAVPVLVLIAVKSLSSSVKKNTTNLVIIITCIIAITIFKVHPILMIFLSAIYGIIFLKEEK